MAKYTVRIDVVMTGEIQIDAKTKKEAKELAKNKYFVPSDVRNFCCTNTRIVEVF